MHFASRTGVGVWGGGRSQRERERKKDRGGRGKAERENGTQQDHPAVLCGKPRFILPWQLWLVSRYFWKTKVILWLISELMPGGEKSKLHLKGIYLFIF